MTRRPSARPRGLAPALALAAAVSSAAALAVCAPARAHPHVWIEVTSDVVLDAHENIVAIAESWTFDALYSSYAVTGLDRNRDGVFSGDELAELTRTIASSNAAEENFTSIRRKDARIAHGAPIEARSEVAPDGRLTYRFRVDLAEPAPIRGDPIRIEIYDPDLYADFRFVKDRAGRLTPPAAGCGVTFDDPQEMSRGAYKSLEDALINGPLTPLVNAIVVAC